MLAQVERDRVRRLWKITIAGLLALFSVAMAAWLSLSPPGKDRTDHRIDPRRSVSKQQAERSEQMAFDLGQLVGSVASIWGGTLAAALLLRSARSGPRIGRRSPGSFAVLFGLTAALTLCGLVLVWMGTDPKNLGNPKSLWERVGGAVALAGGAVALAWVCTRPTQWTTKSSSAQRSGLAGRPWDRGTQPDGDLIPIVEPEPASAAPTPAPSPPQAKPATGPRDPDACPNCGRKNPGRAGSRYCLPCDQTY